MEMEKGKFIEQLTSIIEDTVQGNESVKVYHDIEIKDKYGNDRQIDVMVEYYQNERFTFRTVIECKYKGRDGVEVNQMLAFIKTLETLPNVHQGVFVSTSGFQKAAKIVAEQNDILLYTLEELTKKNVKGWYKRDIVVSKSMQKSDILDWGVLLREEDANMLPQIADLSVEPEEVLLQDSGEKIVVKDLISAIFHFRVNELHNHLLNVSFSGYDIHKDRFINYSVFPLKEGIYLERSGLKIPIGYLELKIKFWVEMEHVENPVYRLYKDQKGGIVADVIAAKVDYSDEGVFLSMVEDKSNQRKEFYLIDGKQNKIKLEIDKEIKLPEKNETVYIMKNPYQK